MSEENGHNHSHENESVRKLGVVSAINVVGFLIEVVGGLLFGSIALLSDAFHMLFDGTAYMIAFGSAFMAEKREVSRFWSFGYHRMETMAAFINGALLIPMAGYILWESYQRFLNPVDIGIGPTIAIGFGGLIVNIASVYYLQGGEMSLNERGAFYHLLGDTGGSVAVIASAAITYYTGFRAADPIAALLISGLILRSSLKVLRESSGILLQKSPLDTEDITSKLCDLEKVHGIRDLRIWSLCSQINVASVHICDESEKLESRENLKNSLREILHENGVDHATIEMEKHSKESCSHELSHNRH